MPYIAQEDRKRFESALNGLTAEMNNGCTPGDLNYLITRLIRFYVFRKGLRYTTLNDVMGALEGAKLEFYRRMVAPYEDEKIRENGDVL
jgi:hypothetical protein